MIDGLVGRSLNSGRVTDEAFAASTCSQFWTILGGKCLGALLMMCAATHVSVTVSSHLCLRRYAFLVWRKARIAEICLISERDSLEEMRWRMKCWGFGRLVFLVWIWNMVS